MRELTRPALLAVVTLVAVVSGTRAYAVPVPSPLTLTHAPAAQSWRTASLSRENDRRGDRPLRVNVEYGGGEFVLGSAEGDVLYSMELRYDADRFEPLAELGDNLLELGLNPVNGGKFDLSSFRNRGEFNLQLAREVPLDLEVAFGAGSAQLELGGLALTGLEIETGASKTEVQISELNPVDMDLASFTVGAAQFEAHNLGYLNAHRVSVEAGVGQVLLGLSGPWKETARLDVEMGLGSLELWVPEGQGLHVERDGLLASFDSEGLIKRGDSYYSENWEDAEYRIHVSLNASFGKVRVVWY